MHDADIHRRLIDVRGLALRIAWLIAQASIAAWYMRCDADESQVIFVFAAILSFPLGLLVPCVVVPISSAVEAAFHLELSTFTNVAIWVGNVAVGYVQWFFMLPGLRLRHARRP